MQDNSAYLCTWVSGWHWKGHQGLGRSTSQYEGPALVDLFRFAWCVMCNLISSNSTWTKNGTSFEPQKWIEMNEFSCHLQSQIISNHLFTVVASKLQPNKVGERRQIVVPPNLGYGNRNIGPIPAGSTLPSLNRWHATGIYWCQPRVLWNSTWIQHHGLPTAHLRLYFDVELKSIVTRWASKFRPTCRLPWKLQNFRAEMSLITQPSSHNCFLHLSAMMFSFWHWVFCSRCLFILTHLKLLREECQPAVPRTCPWFKQMSPWFASWV